MHASHRQNNVTSQQKEIEQGQVIIIEKQIYSNIMAVSYWGMN